MLLSQCNSVCLVSTVVGSRKLDDRYFCFVRMQAEFSGIFKVTALFNV